MLSKPIIAGIFCLFMLSEIQLTAQPKQDSIPSHCSLKLNVGADVVSRYIWRGTDYGNSPAVQPTLSLSAGNFEIGAWGSVALASFYKEVDLYAKYSFKGFSVMLTDYFIPSVTGTPSSPDTRYFVYDDKKTAHSLEGCLMYKGNAKLPLWITGCVFFYGNDKRWGSNIAKDTTEETYYSSYFEAGYTFPIKDKNLDLFVGFTPAAGAYGNALGVVNTGISGSGRIKITDHFELPVKASLIFNPQASNVYFVFGITL